MKKTIAFAMIAIMVLALFAGCHTGYRRTAATRPDGMVSDGVARDPLYRHDNVVTDRNVTRGTYPGGHAVTPGYHPYNRNDSLTRGSEGLFGGNVNGNTGRVTDNHHTARRATDGVSTTNVPSVNVPSARLPGGVTR